MVRTICETENPAKNSRTSIFSCTGSDDVALCVRLSKDGTMRNGWNILQSNARIISKNQFLECFRGVSWVRLRYRIWGLRFELSRKAHFFFFNYSRKHVHEEPSTRIAVIPSKIVLHVQKVCQVPENI